LQEHYVKNVVPKLQEQFNYKSAMEIPRITMISLNMGLGEAVGNKKIRMYEFFDRLISVSIPRIRDFRGLNHKSFDGRGNYTFGLKEQIVFPEIDYDKVDAMRGMDITITTSAKTNEEAEALLRAFNFPLKS